MEPFGAYRYPGAMLLALAGAVASGQAIKVEPVVNPAPQGSVEAHWSSTSDGVESANCSFAFNACPVNGASAAAKDNRVAIAWYTEGGDEPRVQFVLSSDGATFSKPIVINTGDALRHASTVLTDDGGAFVSRIEEGEKSSRVLVRFVPSAGEPGRVAQVIEGSTQNAGYPRLLQAGKETWIACGNSATGRVQTARLVK